MEIDDLTEYNAGIRYAHHLMSEYKYVQKVDSDLHMPIPHECLEELSSQEITDVEESNFWKGFNDCLDKHYLARYE